MKGLSLPPAVEYILWRIGKKSLRPKYMIQEVVWQSKLTYVRTLLPPYLLHTKQAYRWATVLISVSDTNPSSARMVADAPIFELDPSKNAALTSCSPIQWISSDSTHDLIDLPVASASRTRTWLRWLRMWNAP